MNNIERCKVNMISHLDVRLSEKVLLERRENAKKIIAECRRDDCFYASTQSYREPWLRDLVYSEDILLNLGYAKEIKNQRQSRNHKMSTHTPISITNQEQKEPA